MKVALVTGGTKGIGKAIVTKLLSQGCKVYTCYSSDFESASIMKKELSEYDSKLIIEKVDLSSYVEAISYMGGILDQEKQGFDYLIFNAGGTQKKSFEEMDYEGWKKCFDINLNIPLFMIQKAYQHINENGRIVFISSVMSTYEHSSSIAYGVSKASLNSLTKYLVKYFNEKSITVNAVITGFTDTTMIKRTPEHEKRIKDKIALGRFAEPCEIAQFVYHIIEDGYVNGSLMEIDGGYCYK